MRGDGNSLKLNTYGAAAVGYSSLAWAAESLACAELVLVRAPPPPPPTPPPRWNTDWMRETSSLRRVAVNLVVRQSAVDTPKMRLYERMIVQLPSHSMLRKWPIRSKFVMPAQTCHVAR